MLCGMNMPAFMIVGQADGEKFVVFKDTYGDAVSEMQGIECGLGGYAELYEWKGSKYVFLLS